MSRIPPTPKHPPVQKFGPEGDVLIGHTYDQLGNKMYVIQVNTTRSQTSIVLTDTERLNMIRALTEVETPPEKVAEADQAARARAAIWTPQGG